MVGSLQFIVAMIVVQLYYPGYSLSANYISDLGNTANSPLAWLFNDSIRILGVLGVIGAVLLFSAFRARWSTYAGLAFLMIASGSAFAVGTFPENVNGSVHSVVSAITFIGAGLGLLVIALAMVRDTRWQGYRIYTFASGVVTLVATGLFTASIYPVLGPGGMERLIVFPILLWAIVIGIHLLQLGTYVPAPAGESGPTGSSV